MTTSPENPATSPLVQRNLTIKVLGIGGAGGNALGHMAASPLEGLQYVALNTDATALSQCQAPTRMILGDRQFRGLGAGGDPDRGRRAAEEDPNAIRELCQGADMVFVIAGLGGGTGTGASPVVARAARDSGALVLSIVMLPFECEGKRRLAQAMAGLQTLREASDGVICLPNQKVFQLVDENTSLVEAFKITNDLVAQGVRGIWRLLSQPGLINVDFADLCAVTRGQQSAGALVSVEARGEQRVQQILEKLQHHPLYEEGQTLARATSILISIAGGTSLAMKEVNRIMDYINRLGDQAHIIFGTSIDPALEDQLCLTLVASTAPAEPSSATQPTPAPPAEEAAPEASPDPASKAPRGTSRLVPPPPDLSPEQAKEMYLERQTGRRKPGHRLRQGQLPLEIISRGRFEKSEPTLHEGEDLDVPTYIRRGVPLN